MTEPARPRVAAVDIGTNSTRLLVAEAGDPGAGAPLRPLDRRSLVTRLGQGVDATGRLAPEAVERTVRTVAGYADAWRALGVARVGITATSASRDADNAQDFRDAVVAVAGVAPRVLSGEEEAALSFAGAASGLGDVAWPVAVLDIGGGSTEVIVGDAPPAAGATPAVRSTSRQLGAVRLRERVLHGDPPTAAEVAEARRTIAAELDAVADLVDPVAAATLVAVAGTATTLAAVHLGRGGWVDGAVHGTALEAGQVTALAERLLATPVADVAREPAVQQGREDVIAAGALILDEVVRRFGFPRVHVSESDILDGLALELLAGA
jgi:exopolyphosphatase / guanosine-5'-triphosphate,3'-diphosphate pyrophosphatase